MPYKVTNEEGEEIEVFSQEETEAMLTERSEALELEKQSEIDRVASEKEAMEEELQKLRDKDYNFSRLDKKAKGKELEVADELKQQIESLSQRMEQIAAQPKNDVKEDFVNQFIGTDKEQLDRFNYYYERLGSSAGTKEEVLKASQEALTLATNGAYKPDMSVGMYSTGVSQGYKNTPTKEISETSKEIGNIFGISEEDRKKYGKK